MTIIHKRKKVSNKELSQIEDGWMDILFELSDGNNGCKTGSEHTDDDILGYIEYFQKNDLSFLNYEFSEVFKNYLTKTPQEVLAEYKNEMMIKEIIE